MVIFSPGTERAEMIRNTLVFRPLANMHFGVYHNEKGEPTEDSCSSSLCRVWYQRTIIDLIDEGSSQLWLPKPG